jgi:chromosome segregation ATPase
MTAQAAAGFVLALFAMGAQAEDVNPIQKIMQMIDGLQAKIIKEGEKVQKIYEEFSEWCEESNKNLNFEIKTAKAEVVDLKATIDEETAIIESLTTKQEELATRIKTDKGDLKAATYIREKEAAEFAAEKAELDETIDTLKRAIDILAKHASLLQTSGIKSLTQALSALVSASAFSADDAKRLTAMVQESQQDKDDDDDAPDGAPAAAVYKQHSAGIVEVLEDLLQKAETQLGNAQNTETASLHEFQQLKQSIDDALAYANKELAEAKKGIAAAGEKKAAAEGDLAVTTKDLEEDIKALAELHTNCMTKANEFEAETKSRAEELTAIAHAKKVLKETTSGAVEQTYDFVQLRTESEEGLAHFQAVRFVRQLAKKNKAPALTQLANRMASLMRDTHGSKDDIFAKVKGLIADMIVKLEEEANADAKHHAYCQKELKYSNEKKEKRETEIEKLSTAIDEMSAKSAQLKEEVATLEKELKEIANSQVEMDKIRADENAEYKEVKADLELGIEGVKKALKILRDYYSKDAAHDSAEGASSGIMGLLEVCLSDFEKNLADATGEEETAQSEYDKQTKENEVQTTKKNQDVKYKTKEAKDLDKETAEATSDREAVQEQLDAVEKELEKLHEECDETAPTYEELVQRRSAEIAGLKEALQILDGEAALLQVGSVRRHAQVA